MDPFSYYSSSSSSFSISFQKIPNPKKCEGSHDRFLRMNPFAISIKVIGSRPTPKRKYRAASKVTTCNIFKIQKSMKLQ